MESFKRKTPEELLLSISKLHLGRLKIYIGAVSGSGKTYHMLREGRSLKEQGIDVVMCAVSTMQRPETVEQVGDLERIPSIHWMKDGAEKKDLNLDALLERNPEVVLVDGLAHRNRKEAKFPTRMEDIRFLLNRGISIITTVNVYELEGVKELAKKLTGVEVGETVPDNTLEAADEVVLIDATPEMLLSRAAEGHVRLRRGSTFFKHGNLAVLRELSLRLMAEGVNESLDKYREELGLVGPSGATERILVSAQYHWNGSIYVRRGQQIAKRLNGELMVVTFVNKERELSKDEATFRRSIIKLAEKVGGEFEELPLCSRRSLPKILVRYALDHKVTRIVLGHSKQNRWQELWQGSIVHDMLKQTRNIDVFVVADRAEHEGERILPAKLTKPQEEAELFRRLSSLEVERKIQQIRRGRFKVYIGAAPGVGKTYTMLREGNDLLKKGIKVLVGLLETHGRKETLAQVGGLELIPRKVIDYRGTRLEEMDTEEIIRLNPEVVLIDELAHTNVPGSKNKKRYEDVLEILAAGISVISTVNVQHLESLNDAVEQITGVRVRETVPDHILRLADEVQLIDVTPQSLQQRMREGKIYAMDKVDQALGHFFKTGNLIALRELALREIADDVDERLESWERSSSLRGPWRRKEVICVCIDSSPHAERLIRRGFRIAYRLKAAWYVTYVQQEHAALTEELSLRLEQLKKLTDRLGGTFEVLGAVRRKEIPELLVRRADEHQATQIIIGQSRLSFWRELRKGSIVKRLLRRARHIDVLVVADYDRLQPAAAQEPIG
ncbi:universal stress protein [Paenibacillus filicis]|uniref:Universal stress protein n=1 Tax=Paenibacillus gyeongsangnamensis TaxID=3388067 RepID=A0ABT4QF94_9BACL|nr:universal stress protein [Paenibacillus filicis]MCZ8515553.1 universal stress protein [Paenibacillus filicis]